MENSVPDFVLFLGRFHPLVVHLPIGFLLFAFLLEVFSRVKKNPVLTAGIPLALLLGGISALVACILGYMLSLSGDYDENALDAHFWFGVATTALAFLAWLIRIEKIKLSNYKKIQPNIAALTLLVIVISVTGHYGGNLTHGSDYLVKYAPFNTNEKTELAAVTKVEDAEVYGHLVAPILENKCISCHNDSKKKGGLSLVDSLSMHSGGKNGAILVPGNADASELVKRVLLDPHSEDFMPPEGKTPLTEEEIAIVTYWINSSNAGFKTKVANVKTPDNITAIASTMLGFSAATNNTETLPTVGKVSSELISSIEKEGFKIRELVFESNLFEVVLAPNTVVAGQENELKEKLEKLLPIKENIIWLSLENNQVTDESVKIISEITNIQKLKLSGNPISDNAITHLLELKNMTSVNLFGTKITSKSLEIFSKMENLKFAYVWQTSIEQKDLEKYDAAEIPKIVIGL
ncbi:MULTISPECIES: c-type cytochrome domain-containing protein [unclassified Cellulophaga]|uniref:c-type cytochrome domain-containing protein n=1 Tax=unclassified Cellulophaga TaxID=2634405 RepID=UPI0026E30D33|nr:MULTISPECIES: c-type cytochrome domain-containing protein [unclassified Cellulophaga]MDO6492678.1 c-type cytochrome domain-containing protein [Cellulophaga sp. 2_MG-2023]MDO6495935.1 c-type cytochrome domain-containing protein [Cellulophaga sp. 3_MG-2023]